MIQPDIIYMSHTYICQIALRVCLGEVTKEPRCIRSFAKQKNPKKKKKQR